MAVTEQESVERLFFCRHCRRRLPRDLMVAEQKSRFGVSTSCRECWRGRERRHDLEINLGWTHFDDAPDLGPTVTFRELLDSDRRQGLSFNEIFEEDCVYAVRHLRPQDRKSYLSAWQDTRSAWEAEYGGLDVPGGLSRGLLADVERY